MKKSILNLGRSLNKVEQRQVNGKAGLTCDGFEMYYVNDCNQCINTIIPDGPTLCFDNCCVMAY